MCIYERHSNAHCATQAYPQDSLSSNGNSTTHVVSLSCGRKYNLGLYKEGLSNAPHLRVCMASSTCVSEHSMSSTLQAVLSSTSFFRFLHMKESLKDKRERERCSLLPTKANIHKLAYLRKSLKTNRRT